MNFMFSWQKRHLTSERSERVHSFAALTREMSFLPREHKIHIFEPTCNVLFIIWRPDVSEIADFYFIVFEKSSKVYKSPFVFTENTKHQQEGNLHAHACIR